MSRLLEILGCGITVDTADLIWHWLDAAKLPKDSGESSHYRQLRKAIDLLGDAGPDAAQKHLNMYLFENPACTYGRMAAAAICLQRNQLNPAVEQLTSVYMRQPSNTMALYALGHCHERLGNEAQAIEFYQDCLKFRSYLQLPAQRLAAIYFKNGQLEKTIQQYEQLKTEYPDDISILVTLGHLYIAGTRYAKAIETFNTAILIHPDNFHAPCEHIDQLIQQCFLDEALDQLDDLLQQQPDRADLLMRRADVLNMLGATSEALCQYEEAVRLCPDFLEATIKLGTLYLQSDQCRLAAQQFNKAVEINDKIVDAYIGLATAQKLAGHISDALLTLSLAAAIQPNSSLLFAEAATLQFKGDFAHHLPLHETPDSLTLINTIIKAHHQQITDRPRNPELHYRLGLLLASIDRPKDAIGSFRTALAINQTYHRARTKLAVCLYHTHQERAALEQLTAPDSLNRDTLQLHYKLALLYCDKPKFASSLISLERNMHKNLTSPDAAVNISIVLQNLGLLDRVNAMWHNLLDTANQTAQPDLPFP